MNNNKMMWSGNFKKEFSDSLGGQFKDLLTIAFMGRYTDKQLSYALNTVFGQDYPELELILSVCGEDSLINTATATLDAHNVQNMKRVCIDQRTGEIGEKERLKYLWRHMTGRHFILLSEGACFYENDSLTECMRNDGTEQFVLGVSVVYDKDDNYLGDIREEMYGVAEEFLQQTLLHHGGIIMPGSFADSDDFYAWIAKGGELKDAILGYLSQHAECKICVRGNALLKCYKEHV